MLVSNRLESPADRADRHTGDLSLVTRPSPPRHQARPGRTHLGGRGPGADSPHSPGDTRVIMRLTDMERTPPPLDDTELWHCHTSDNRKLSQILCLLLWPPLTRHRWPVTTNSQSVKENRREILMFISPSGEMEILSLYNCQLTFIRLQCPTINIVYNSKI